MRIETHPKAAGLAAALVYSAIWMWLIALSHGCSRPAVAAPAPIVGMMRTPLEAADAAVFIITSCDRAGSGVLVNSEQILTAFHVVNCGEMGTNEPASEVDVELRDGTRLRARFEVIDVKRDLARLRVRPVPYVKSVRIAGAKKGDLACSVTGYPERGFECGRVTGFEADRIITDHKTLWLGNSGSGTYNKDGELIGLAVGTYFCSQFEAEMHKLLGARPQTMCGGSLSSIIDSPVKP